jgi:hypothetical protein
MIDFLVNAIIILLIVIPLSVQIVLKPLMVIVNHFVPTGIKGKTNGKTKGNTETVRPFTHDTISPDTISPDTISPDTISLGKASDWEDIK